MREFGNLLELENVKGIKIEGGQILYVIYLYLFILFFINVLVHISYFVIGNPNSKNLFALISSFTQYLRLMENHKLLCHFQINLLNDGHRLLKTTTTQLPNGECKSKIIVYVLV